MTEIFIEPELENLQDEVTATEWFNVVSELGLEHQVSLADRSETKKAPPYMFIDPKTDRIIETLCPRRVDYKEYRVSTIPLDVLQEIQKCVTNGWYKYIKIAYDDKSPDPFVIGYTHSESDWSASKHLIARWGAELVPFEQLRMNAISRARAAVTKGLEKLKFQVQYALDNPDEFIDGLLGGEEKPSLDTGRYTNNLPF